MGSAWTSLPSSRRTLVHLPRIRMMPSVVSRTALAAAPPAESQAPWAGPGQLALAAREGQANRLLGQGRRAISGRPPEQDVGDVEVAFAAHADGVETRGPSAGSPRPRSGRAQPVLVGARRRAHHHDRRRGHAVGVYRALAVRLIAQPSKARMAASSSTMVAQRRASSRASSTSCGDLSGTGRVRKRRRRTDRRRRSQALGYGCRKLVAAGGGRAKRSMASSPMVSAPARCRRHHFSSEGEILVRDRRPGHCRRFEEGAQDRGPKRAVSAWLATRPLLVGSST